MGVYIPATPSTIGAVLQELAERAVGSTLEGLREHRDDHICLEWGCRALRTLIMDRYVTHCVMLYVTHCVILYVTLCVTLNIMHNSTDQKKYMEMCLALFDLISILEQQDSNPVLLGEAFAAITCLTDISMSLSPHTTGVLLYFFMLPVEQLRKEACHQHIYTKVLEAVSKHPRNSFLSEVAIEQLTILLNYSNYYYIDHVTCNPYTIVAEMVDILNDANTLPKVIRIMKEHINIPCESLISSQSLLGQYCV